MQRTQDTDTPPRADGSSRSPISVALLAGIAFVPIVVAAGFLTDRSEAPSSLGDISVAQLRGALDRGPVERPPVVSHAGF